MVKSRESYPYLKIFLSVVLFSIIVAIVVNSTAGGRSSFAGHNVTTAFLRTAAAQGISGACVFLALIVTCHQIVQHLRHYHRPNEQRHIVRILFIVPIYGLASWLSLLSYNGYIYFDTVRDCYEAFVIYNFLSLCFEYLGGDFKILQAINGLPVRGYCWTGTCLLSSMKYSSGFLRFCKQATLQFCFVKPVVAIITIILKADNKYKDGDWAPTQGYLYQTIVYNFSISLALYALILFYHATSDLLRPFDPVLKFLTVKFIIFLSFWQGVALSIAEHVGVIAREQHGDPGAYAKGIQNFLICIEMVVAALMLYRAFPVAPYYTEGQLRLPVRTRPWGRLSRLAPNKKTVVNFTDTLNPSDMFGEAIKIFGPNYKGYVQHPNSDDEGKETTDLKDQSPSPVEERLPEEGSMARLSPTHAHARLPRSTNERADTAGEEEEEEEITLVFDRNTEQRSLLPDR